MLAAILLAELTLFVGLTQTGSGDSTRVVGRVTRESRPAAHALVLATSGSDVQTTVADAHGRYAFLTLMPGVYHLTACEPRDAIVFVVSSVRPLPPPQTLRPYPVEADDNFVELSAGVEYLANLSVGAGCAWR